MSLPTAAEMYDLWRAAWPERVPDRRGFEARLSSDDEIIWRRGHSGGLTALALGRAPETHPYAYLRLLIVHPEGQRQGLGRELVAELRERLGPQRLALGEERGHFFPGVTASSLPFWQKVGFRPTGGQCVDMVRDLRTDLAPAVFPEGLRCLDGHVPGVLEGALQLTSEVFSPRWHFDLQTVANVAPGQVLALLDGPRVIGFALTGRQDDPSVLPSFLYPQSLRQFGSGAEMVGGLGPIGLHPDWRGQGLGSAFMLACMHHLKGRGVELMGIDWTGIAPFYEKLGFQAWATYHHLRG